MHIIPASRQTRMPWKNGGGETIEVAVHPAGASTSGFDWRISMAPFTTAGAFSLFEGVDRTLAVLSGDGVVLDIDGVGSVTLEQTSAPYRFPADAPTRGRLVRDPTVNLNVMARRDGLTHKVESLVIAGTVVLADHARWTVVLPRGPVRLEGSAESAALDAGDAASLERGDGSARMTSARPTLVYVVTVDDA